MCVAKAIVQRRLSRLISVFGVLACGIGAAGSASAASELESFEAAVYAEDKQAALAFIDEFGSSHLIGDLIDLLRPEVAQAVCADLPSGASSARSACRKLETRRAAAQGGIAEPQPDASRAATVEHDSLQPSAQDAALELGLGDAGIAPGAGPAVTPQKLAGTTTSRDEGSTSERSDQPQMILMPKLADNAANSDDGTGNDTGRQGKPKQEPDDPPTHHHKDEPAPTPGLGSDPGSDPGAASSPSSQGKDPGGDGGNGAGSGGDHDSHN